MDVAAEYQVTARVKSLSPLNNLSLWVSELSYGYAWCKADCQPDRQIGKGPHCICSVIARTENNAAGRYMHVSCL